MASVNYRAGTAAGTAPGLRTLDAMTDIREAGFARRNDSTKH